MTFVLPSFSAASNYAANFRPVQPLIMPDNVKSDFFKEAIKEADQLEYAAAAQAGGAALAQLSAVQRQQMVNDAAMDRLKFAEEARNKITKPQRMAALANLLAPSGGGQQSRGGGLTGPLDQLRSLTRGFDDLDYSDAVRTKPFYDQDEAFWKSMPAPPQPSNVGLPAVTKVTTPTSSPPELNSMEAQAKSRQAFEKIVWESLVKQLSPNTTK